MPNKVKVSVSDIIEKEELENLTPEIPTDNRYIETWEINRPALQLTGWYYDFDEGRIQVMGNVESAYMQSMDNDKARAAYDEFTAHNLPCLIYANSNMPGTGMIAACHRNHVPLLVSHKTTTSLTAELTRWLKVQLAERVTVHGVLVDVYGIGVLIMGDSGIGKSEVALELIRRGHSVTSVALPPLPEGAPIPEEMEILFGDINKKSDEEIEALLSGCDVFIFAAGVDERVEFPAPVLDYYYKYNIAPLERILPLCKKAGVKRAVVLGSYFAYLAKLRPDMKLTEKNK